MARGDVLVLFFYRYLSTSPLCDADVVGTKFRGTGFRDGLTTKACWMPYFLSRSLIFWSVLFLFISSGCIAAPECDSIETRKAVLDFVSGDGSNPLVTYAAKNSTAGKDAAAGKSPNPDSEKPLYQLGQNIVTTSTSKDKQTVKCSGGISAAVDDTKATKEVTFTVQQSADGKISVSVDPFKF